MVTIYYALVCVSCFAEVALVTADDLAAMESLPDHDCPKEAAA
jgi:hypothetical protein